MSSNKILSVLNQQIQNNNNLIKSYEKNLASVELKDGNVFLIYDDFSKINLGKFLDNDNSVYKEAKLVKKNYGHDLALTTTSDEVLVINNIEESFKLPKYNNVRVNKIGIETAEVKNSHLYLYQEDGTKIDAGFVVGQKGDQGPRGRSGIQGNVGDEGPRGNKGERGESGDRGPKGVRGDVGSQGGEGPQGERGIKGMKGDTGEQGERGERGPRGNTGLEGEQGQKGEPGKEGSRGMKGSQGDIGETGKTGLSGTIGPKGPIGQKGERGPEGGQGLLGPRGLTGTQGEKGSKGTSGSMGEKGQKGGIGPEGDIGPRGHIGDRGPKGLKGEVGVIGPMGPQGIQGVQGEKGNLGLKGEYGPKGGQGDKGDAGPPGIHGAYIDTRGYLQIVTGEEGNQSTEPAGKVVPSEGMLGNYSIGVDKNISDTMTLEQSNCLGRIVVANGQLNTNYNMDTIRPKCSFSSTQQQINVFGVISHINPNYARNRGQGVIWVIENNGPIKNGSLIQTSKFLGYGELQSDNQRYTYTIAKSLIDCNFDVTNSGYKCYEITLQGSVVKCALIPCTLICG